MPPVAIECVRNIRREALASFWEACHVAKQNGTKPDHMRRVWRGGAGGDKLIGLSIDLEELHSASRALEARVDEALAGNQELQSYVQRLDSGLVDEDQEPPTS
jgi:3-hydroxyisobutyrate dehydrogenase-like beta-hydroxyacid dehydrogenase